MSALSASVSVFRRLAEHALRHRLDAVDAGAEIDAIEVQLEDLLLAELRLDQEREHRFARLAAVALAIREKQRARQLLRDACCRPARVPDARRCEARRAPSAIGSTPGCRKKR